jgi:hypothetical protein
LCIRKIKKLFFETVHKKQGFWQFLFGILDCGKINVELLKRKISQAEGNIPIDPVAGRAGRAHY